jgi:hypothetical protein
MNNEIKSYVRPPQPQAAKPAAAPESAFTKLMNLSPVAYRRIVWQILKWNLILFAIGVVALVVAAACGVFAGDVSHSGGLR